MFQKKNLLGIDIYDTKMPDLLNVLKQRIENNQKTIVFGVSSMTFGRFKFRPDLYKIYKYIDIVIAEGAGVPLLAGLFGKKISGKIGLINLSRKLFDLSDKENYKIMLFGADPETNKLAREKLQEMHPNIRFCEGISGYFEEEDLPEIVNRINKCEPDILFIGISYPIKERFAVKYKDELKTKLIVPCGGAFDVFAGRAKKYKEISRYIPTAWLVRFIQEPVRLFKPIILTMLYSLLWVYPALFLKHIFIKRNPDVGKHFGLTGNEWDVNNGNVRP